MTHLSASFEENEGWQYIDRKEIGQLAVVVNVDLEKNDICSVVARRPFFQDRRYFYAWITPRSVEIAHDQDVHIVRMIFQSIEFFLGHDLVNTIDERIRRRFGWTRHWTSSLHVHRSRWQR